MPFGKAFDDVEAIIRGAVEECDLEYVRGDLSQRPGSVIQQVVHEINRASVIIADITGHNPNVFYELGIAHHVRGPERVVIITQEVNAAKAYDVHQFRQFLYTHSEAGRASLRRELPALLRTAAESASDRELWSVVRGRVPRTRLIARDLRRMADDRSTLLDGNDTIRVVAGLSSLAISHLEPPDPAVDAEYASSLIAERNALFDALEAGANLKAVLNPPRRFVAAMLPERICRRYRRLIGLLEGRSDVEGDPERASREVAAMARCQFALSPVPMPNLMIIGRAVAYEGMKRGGGGGFSMTHCETDKNEVQAMIAQFDDFFAMSQDEMRRTHPPNSCFLDQCREFYRCAVAET